MNPNVHAKCRDGVNCTGIGCRASTGKTKRKVNHARPKRNKHEATRIGTPDRKAYR